MSDKGYILTIRAFVPFPKEDFAKQAAAANFMQGLTANKTLPDNFAETVEILDIKHKFGAKPGGDDEPGQKPE